jgi:neopullulanase
LDVPGEIDDDSFWREFRRRVKAANPDAYIVGEIWGDASRWLQGDQFDAVMNYGVSRLALGFFGRETMDREYRPGGFRIPQLGARAFLNETERLLSAYAWPITLAQMNLLDSHDTSRFLTQAGHDRSALELSLTYLATLPGAPCIYYGTEVGMRGGPDPECRGAFLWDSDRWDRELLARTQRILALRREHPALRRGGFSGLYGHDDLVAYARESADETALVVINAAREARGLVLDVSGLLPDGIHHDLLQGLPAGVTHGNLRHLQLPPRAAAVFTAWRG